MLCQHHQHKEILRIRENHPLLEGAERFLALPPGTTYTTNTCSDPAGRCWRVCCPHTELLSPWMNLSRLEPIDAGLPDERKAHET